MKKLLVLALFGMLAASEAKVLADYSFKDKTCKDLSGGNAPLTQPDSKVFVGDAVDLEVNSGIRLPVAAFPGAGGTIEAQVQCRKNSELRLLLCYYGGGDVFYVVCSNNRFQARYYNRAGKKWYNSKFAPEVPETGFVDVKISWQFPGKLTLTANGKSVELPVDAENGFVSNSIFMLGSNQRKELPFSGMIKSLRITDGK